MAGHANYRITLDMYVRTTAGVLDRARTVTQLPRPGHDKRLGQRAACAAGECGQSDELK